MAQECDQTDMIVGLFDAASTFNTVCAVRSAMASV